MNPKVRNNFAVVAVGALACSLSFAPVAMATPETGALPVAPTGDAFRVAGQSRFGTAIAASVALRPNGGTVALPAQAINSTVILSNYLSWSDVLAATPLADELNAPVLYTYADRLEDATKDELRRLAKLGVRNVTIVGGELAVNKAVAAELASLDLKIVAEPTAKLVVDRVGGTSRFDTAMLLAAETVDYYNGGGGSATAVARKDIAVNAQKEAKFVTDYAALGVAQKSLVDAINAQNTATAVVTSAESALAAITNGLVPSAPVADVVVNPAQVATPVVPATANASVTVKSLSEFNSLLASYKYRAADAEAVTAFVNARATEYVASGGVETATWQLLENAIEAATPGKLFTIPLKAGDVTGTIAQLTDALGNTPNTGLGFFAVADPSSTVISDVKTGVTGVKTATASYLVAVQAAYDTYLQNTLAAIKANSDNDALQPQINAASAKLTAAKAAQSAAVVATGKATIAYNAADVDFKASVLALPTPAAKLLAQANYDAALKAALQAGTAYPAFLATGLDFPDALAAGPAAASQQGVVLLTNGATMAPATQQYLDSKAAAVTVGGPAAAAYPKAAKSFVGQSRYETATKLAAAYFGTTSYIGLASGEVAADAVIGGALLANLDGTLVLTRQNLLPDATASFLSYNVVSTPRMLVMGGKLAISNDVRDDAVDALKN